MIRNIAYLAIVVFIFSGIHALAADSAREAAALSAAEKWLALVDRGKYGESWEDSAALFKNAVRPGQWTQSMQAVREPLGRLVSRSVKTLAYRTALPGAPDGEYVVIEFETAFENKKAAVETVIPMMDPDGVWRVSGYTIK